VIDGREYWVGDDLAGVLLVEADADGLALLAAAEIAPPLKSSTSDPETLSATMDD
jgi:hypothetical protein